MNSAVVIAGGGLAGAAAAIQLARAGRSVVLVERDAQPQHKVCGEFLSQETLEYLQLLGVDAAQLGAVALRSVRLCGARGESVAAFPFTAMSLTRRTLDDALLRQAEANGAVVLRGERVEKVARCGELWQVRNHNGRALQANDVFIATGKHDLHGAPRPAGKQSNLIAFKMYFALTAVQAAALEGHVELLVYRGGYAGLQPVEEGAANLCCVIERAEFQRLGSRWDNLLETMIQQLPNLRTRLQGANALLERPLAIAPIPYGFVREQSDGPWYLGDQAVVIPSFTGDGMAIALHSGLVAAEMYLAGKSSAKFQRRLQVEVKRQVSIATIISRGLISWAAPSMLAATRMWPGLLRTVARQTRLRAMAGALDKGSTASASVWPLVE